MSAFAEQIAIPRIEMLSNEPGGYVLRDWKQVAVDYDDISFNPDRTGEYLPLSRLDKTGMNFPFDGVGICASVGFNRLPAMSESGYTVLGGIVGASLVGIDKSNQFGLNFVNMAMKFFNIDNERYVALHTANYGGRAEKGVMFHNIILFRDSGL